VAAGLSSAAGAARPIATGTDSGVGWNVSASSSPQLPAPLRPYRDTYSAQVQRAIGCQRWNARRAEGSALDRRAAVALALREPPPDRGAQPEPLPGGAASPLTRRQQEVAALVAHGLTDREIAARLVISTRTAEYHVEQILSRLGFRSRAEIAAWSAALGR
jgi:non-specific serine/threonine protein kinase